MPAVGGADSLAVSDIVWVRSVNPSPSPGPTDVLYSSEGEIIPELEPMLGRDRSAAFYFVTYPSLNTGDEPEAQIAVQRDGKALTSSALTGPAPDESGAYRYSGILPLSQLEPGDYVLSVTVSQNGTRTTKEALFRVH